VDELRSLSQWPVLDAGCGFGRNAVALALRGVSVVCIDRNAHRLGTLSRLAPGYIASHQGSEKGWDRSSFYARTRAAAGRIALYLNDRLLDPISR
jgi:SAM-dependent methyltransferase